MGVGKKVLFIYGFIILVSFSLTLKEKKVEIEVIEPIIAYSNCEERNYSNIDFLEIKNIQTFLKNENYFAGTINGYKDEFLISSIKAFQKAVGIRVDGIIGPSTHKAMTSFDPCEREVTAPLISCNGYLAYKECTWFLNNELNTSASTTVAPIEQLKYLVVGNNCSYEVIEVTSSDSRYASGMSFQQAETTKNEFNSWRCPNNTTENSSNLPTINSSLTFSITENQQSVISVVATNPVTGLMTYTLSGEDAHLMTISSSGVISLNSNANYEEKTSYSATVEVSNVNGTTSKDMSVQVSDISENATVDILYVAAGGARDISNTIMSSAIDEDISDNNTIFSNSQVDITYTKRAFINSTETFNVSNNNEFYNLWQDSDDSTNKIKYGADYVIFFSGKVANPDPTDFSYRYGPYAGFNPNGTLDSSIDNSTNWSAQDGGRLIVTYAYYSCNAFTLVCEGPMIAATNHELGHNLNGNHSRTQISSAASGNGYNYGYQGGVYQDGFITVMSYNGRAFPEGNDYSQSSMNVFSNPDINCTGAQGTTYPCGVEDETDFSRYLNENKFKYQDMLERSNLGETTDSYSILSSAYFPLNDGAESTFTNGSTSKTFYTIKGSDTTVSGTSYQTFKWCDDATCDLSGSDKRIALEIYVNNGNYYLKSQHFDQHYGGGSAGGSVALTFSAPCLFMEKYQVLGDYAETNCNSTVQYFDTTEGSSYNFHNYASKELAYSPYGSYDTKKFLYTYYDREGHVIERYVFWLSDEVGIVKFLDSNDVLWRLTAVDSDGDGTGNKDDTDDDGDGVLDTADDFPLDPSLSSDSDSDGIADQDE